MNWPNFLTRLLYRVNGVPRPITEEHIERLSREVWDSCRGVTDGYIPIRTAEHTTRVAIEKWERSWNLYNRQKKEKK